MWTSCHKEISRVNHNAKDCCDKSHEVLTFIINKRAKKNQGNQNPSQQTKGKGKPTSSTTHNQSTGSTPSPAGTLAQPSKKLAKALRAVENAKARSAQTDGRRVTSSEGDSSN